MKLCINNIYYALSFALDEVENEIIKVKKGHGKRTALLAVFIGSRLHLTNEALNDLVGLAILHDNALTEYIYEEKKTLNNLGKHCIIGQENIKNFPFFTDIMNAILYYHERYDGLGIFKIKDNNSYASLIHAGDFIDVYMSSGNKSYADFKAFINKASGKELEPNYVAILDKMNETYFNRIKTESIEVMINEIITPIEYDYSFNQLKEIVNVFTKIIDYKSEFTKNHSIGIANKAYEMAHFYQKPESECEKLYLAGAFHDIGKMAINNDILEKPDKLNDLEFSKMKNHAYLTYVILSQIKDFDDITTWVSYHHEKLNGKGYPFNKTASELDFNSRLLAVLDIYQALSEPRPYKDGFKPEVIKQIMDKMADNNEIDKNIYMDVSNYYNK